MEYLSLYILGFLLGAIATFSEMALCGRSYYVIDGIENYKQRVTLKCHWWTSTILYVTYVLACFGEVIWLIKTLFSFI